MKFLVVGNGSTGENEKGFWVNNHTGEFLVKLSEKADVTFTEPLSEFDQNNNLLNFNLDGSNVKVEGLKTNWKNPQFLRQVFRMVRKNDFLYLFYPGTISKLVALTAIIMRKRYGLYVRGQYYKGSFVDRFILRKATFILTVSPSIAVDLQNYCQRVEVIKPMISIGPEDLYRHRTTSKGTIKILFVGRVEERKGIYELIEISSILKHAGTDFIVHIVGGGDKFREIENLILRDGLSDNIKIHGLVSDEKELNEIYRSSDLFLFTSHDEGFPRVLYEAMAAGLPIFTTFVGGISGRMKDGFNCYEIPVKNAALAAQILQEKIRNTNELSEIASNGIKTMEAIVSGSYKDHDQLLINMLNDKK